jgi:hypothetical protein
MKVARRSGFRWSLGLAALALAVTACSTTSQVKVGAPSASVGGPAPGSGSAPTTANGSPTPAEPEEPPPAVGQCRGPIDATIVDAAADPRPTVACDKPHGSETFYVGEMDPSITTWPGTTDDPSLGRQVDQACTSRHQAYVGVTEAEIATLPPDRLQDFAYFIPTRSDFAAGARWFRCDAIVEPLEAGESTTIQGTLKGVYAKPLPVAYRLCEASLNRLAACNKKHQIEYLASVQLPDLTEYPAQRGDIKVSAACRTPLLAALGLSEERADIAFGYVLPSQDVWDAGFQTATCIAGAANNAALGNTLYRIGPTKPLPLAPR